jgi:ABC-type nitrate/sulfonate/bicarbonate transport system substrate-binding protein
VEDRQEAVVAVREAEREAVKRLAEKIREALARQLRAHGVEASDEIVAAVANNLVYAVVEAVEDAFDTPTSPKPTDANGACQHGYTGVCVRCVWAFVEARRVQLGCKPRSAPSEAEWDQRQKDTEKRVAERDAEHARWAASLKGGTP